MKRKERSALKKAVLVACIAVCLGVFVVVGTVAWTLWATSRQIAYGQAVSACSDLSGRAQTQLIQANEYSIIDSGRHCVAQEDELGATDYILSTYFVLGKDTLTASDVTKADLDAVAARLSGTDYSWAVSNEVSAEGRSRTICAVASAYLNNDGKLLDQGTSGVRVTYNDPAVPGVYASVACSAL